MFWKTWLPRPALGVVGAGTGSDDKRENAAKLTVSDEKSEAGLPLVSVGDRMVLSSGVPLNWQFGSVSRSLGKSSLVTPCSTLYASPAKISSDLFCAFQPKRVIVPSLPLVLKRPAIPAPLFVFWSAFRFAASAP